MISKKQELLELGKMQPQAIELEEVVLGACMLDSDSVNIVSDILNPNSFYKESHKIIFTTIIALYKKSNPVDILTITEELKKTGELDIVGGPYYITTLTNRISSGANVEFHARIIAQKYIQRELIRIASKAISNAYEDNADCFDLMDDLEKDLTSVTKYISVGKTNSIPTLWNQVAERNIILLQKKGISGIPCGYRNIDAITGGWQPSDLIIIAARPAMGKTSLLCNIARNASVDFQEPGVIFSLEMSALQLAIRLFSLESDLSIGHFTRKGIPEDQMLFVQKDCTRLINAPLYIDDSPGLNIMELRSKARKLKREKGIKWIGIDYLQLMEAVNSNGFRGNREQDVAAISRALKALAKELGIPIIALSQLSRATETRGGDKRPILSDLRESGAIEQDADMVIFIHRPEYYLIKEYGDGESTEGIAEIIFAKNRNGAIGTEKLKFIDYLTKFAPLDSDLPFVQTSTVDFTEPKKIEANNNFLDEPF